MNATAQTTAQTAITAIKNVLLVGMCLFAALTVFGVGVAGMTGQFDAKPAAAGPLGCWNEPNAQMPGGYELLQGRISDAPVGSIIADCPR